MFTVYPILEKYSNLVNQFLEVQRYFQQIIKKKKPMVGRFSFWLYSRVTGGLLKIL